MAKILIAAIMLSTVTVIAGHERGGSRRPIKKENVGVVKRLKKA